MDGEAEREQGRRDQDRSRVENVGVGGDDDEAFSNLDDTGAIPSENPAVDDV